MSFMDWKPEFSVGVAEIDSQHKKLVALLSRLYEAMQEGNGKEALGSVLSELVNYCNTHFAAEERLMSKYGYPGLENHKGVHRKMTIKAASLERDFTHSAAPPTIQVANFLKDWLTKHIMETDMAYAPFFKEKGLS